MPKVRMRKVEFGGVTIQTKLEDGVLWAGEFGMGSAWFGKQHARSIRPVLKSQKNANVERVATGHTGHEQDSLWIPEAGWKHVATSTRNREERARREAQVEKFFDKARREYKLVTPVAETTAAAEPVPEPVVETAAPNETSERHGDNSMPSSETVSEPEEVDGTTTTIAVLDSAEVPVLGTVTLLKLDNGKTGRGQLAILGKQVSTRLGPDWPGQLKKIQNSRCKEGLYKVVVHTPGGPQTTYALTLRFFNLWVLNISPEKVKPEFRVNVETIQDEWLGALENYVWGSGVNVNPRVPPEDAWTAFKNEMRTMFAAGQAQAKTELLALLGADYVHREDLRGVLNEATQSIQVIKQEVQVLDGRISPAALLPKIESALKTLGVVMQPLQTALHDHGQRIAVLEQSARGVPAPDGHTAGTRPVVLTPQQPRLGTYSSRNLADEFSQPQPGGIKVPYTLIVAAALALRFIGDTRFGEPSAHTTTHHGYCKDNWRHNESARVQLRLVAEGYILEVLHQRSMHGKRRSAALAKANVLGRIIPIGHGTWTSAQRPVRSTNNVHPIRPNQR